MVGGLLLGPATWDASADEPGEVVTFTYTQEVPDGLDLFLLGSLTELGAGDQRRAVRMLPGEGSEWNVSVRLPPGVPYSHRYIASGGLALCSTIASTASPVLHGDTPGSPVPKRPRRL